MTEQDKIPVDNQTIDPLENGRSSTNEINPKETNIQIEDPDCFDAETGKFTVTDGTVYLSKLTRDGYSQPFKVFADIEILGKARDEEESNWGRVVRFKNRNNCIKKLLLADKDLTGKGDPIRETLSDNGFPLFSRRGITNILCDFIYYRPLLNAPTHLITHKTGWIGNAYVLPDGEQIGQYKEPIFYQPEGFKSANFETKGNLENWIKDVASYAQYSPSLMLALCAGFGASLMPKLAENHETGGFHFYGVSSSGKTLITATGASIYGKPTDQGGRLIPWSATANSLEYWAEAHNHSLFTLDELKQAKPQELASTLYSLGNATGKARLGVKDSDLKMRRMLSWKLLWLSTGELTTTQYIEQVNSRADAGTEIRSIPIEIDMGVTMQDGRSMGMFEKLPNGDTGEALSLAFKTIYEGLTNNYGVAGRAWIKFLVDNPSKIQEAETKWTAEFERLTPTLGSQQQRQARRFRLCAIAGELATEAGLTGWNPGDATNTMIRMMLRSFEGNQTETKEKRRLIKSFIKLVQNLSDFPTFQDVRDGKAKSKILGYRNFEIEESNNEKRIYLLDETYEKAIGNFQPDKASKILADEGIQIRERIKNGHFRNKAKVFKNAENKMTRYYTLKYEELLKHDDE